MIFRVPVFFFILVIFATATDTLGQTKNGDWRSVEALEIDTLVWVEPKNDQAVIGYLNAVSSSGLELRRADGSGNLSFARTQVKKVYYAVKKSRGRLIGIGAAVGAGIGLGLGLLAASRSEDANIGAIFFPIGGAGVGAAIGAARTGKIKKGRLIFEST